VRLLVYPHELSIGGSQINAVDLAASMQQRGHDVRVYGIAGPLTSYVEARGLRFVSANRSERRPALARIQQLMRLARDERVDLIHAYEWAPCLDAYFGAHLLRRISLVCTVLSMSVSRLVPESVPLIMGTRQLQQEAQAGRRNAVDLLEPPIDTDADRPVDATRFIAEHDLNADALTVGIVSRLSADLKLDSLERAIDAVSQLASEWPVRLVIVGGGEALDPLSRRAAAANARLGRQAIILTGPLMDPRPAYTAADIILGMGSSALRGMAFGKPVIVQGEAGFSEILTPESAERFLWQGFFGVGDGRPGATRLASQLLELLRDAARRRELGAFSRRLVVERFSLDRAAARLEAIYQRTRLEQPTGTRLGEAMTVAGRAITTEIRYHLPRHRRRQRQRSRRLAAAGGA
jgi:glycosyltransferase involved in cell wall biosynthesis